LNNTEKLCKELIDIFQNYYLTDDEITFVLKSMLATQVKDSITRN